MIVTVDKNKDGKINYSEFRVNIHNIIKQIYHLNAFTVQPADKTTFYKRY